MDRFDSQRYASIYRTLAEVLERERPADREENRLSYVLGDLTRRIFVGTQYVPPDELLEEVVHLIRTGQQSDVKSMAQRLRDHADHLDDIADK